MSTFKGVKEDVEKGEEALKIVADMARVNGKSMPSITAGQINAAHARTALTHSGNISDLWAPSLRKTTFLLMIIWAGHGFCYYGIVLFIPRIFPATGDDGALFNYTPIFISTCAELIGTSSNLFIIPKVGPLIFAPNSKLKLF